MRDEDLDRDLSALLDGELTPTRARELREQIEADPRLRERLAAFESVEQRLKALPQPALPADLRARLRQRIDPLEAHGEQEPAQDHSLQATPLLPRWGVPMAAVAAAGLVAAWLMRPIPDAEESTIVTQGSTGGEISEQPLEGNLEQDPEQFPEQQLAQTQTQARVDPDRALDVDPLESEGVAEDPSDEELAIALDFETLRDLDVIQELDLLEALAALEAMEVMEEERRS